MDVSLDVLHHGMMIIVGPLAVSPRTNGNTIANMDTMAYAYSDDTAS